MPSPRILIVDDSRTVRSQIQRSLSRAGYTVAMADDGDTAIEQARQFQPQLIVLDVRMPGMDGYGVCQELKAMGKPWNELPIVFLTSVESHALSLLGSAMGAYLKKPVCPDELLRVIAAIFANRGVNEVPEQVREVHCG